MLGSLENIKNVAAISPIYGVGQGGNCTRIYCSSGDVTTDSRKATTILQNIAHHFGANPQAIQQNYGKMLNCKLTCPLVFGKNQVYIPVKVRSPFVKNDGATGYFNLAAFEGLELITPNPGRNSAKCTILLKGGHRIKSHYSPGNIEKRINLALSVRERYCFLHDEFSLDSVSPELHQKNSTKMIKIKKGLYFKLVTGDEDEE